MRNRTSAPSDMSGLIVLGMRQPWSDYLRDLWERRHFATALAASDLRSSHADSILGQLWHLLNPAMMIAVYFLVFGVVLEARQGVDHFLTFLVIGVIVFRFCQNAIIGAGKSLATNDGLIRSIQFPRAIVPMSEVLAELMTLVPGLILVLVVGLLDGVALT
jgi:teichoic acid transport system permease protein